MFQDLRLLKIKKQLELGEKKDKSTRSAIRLALADAQKDVGEIIINRKGVSIKTKNKAAANELFLKKDSLKKYLPEEVTELEIR